MRVPAEIDRTARKAAVSVAAASAVLLASSLARGQTLRPGMNTQWPRFSGGPVFGVGSTVGFDANIPRLAIGVQFRVRASSWFSAAIRANGSGFILPECRVGCAPLGEASLAVIASLHVPRGERDEGIPQWEPILSAGFGAFYGGWFWTRPTYGVAVPITFTTLIRADERLMIGPFVAADVFIRTEPTPMPLAYATLHAGVALEWLAPAP